MVLALSLRKMPNCAHVYQATKNQLYSCLEYSDLDGVWTQMKAIICRVDILTLTDSLYDRLFSMKAVFVGVYIRKLSLEANKFSFF